MPTIMAEHKNASVFKQEERGRRHGVIANFIRESILFRIYTRYIVDSLVILRKDGVKGLVHKRGWKFVAAILMYYLIRDALIYGVIPYCIAQGIL